MNLYDLNKSGYASIPPMTQDELKTARQTIADYLRDHAGSKYFMLLNNDTHYYTIFVRKHVCPALECAKEITSLVEELGAIKAIEKTDNDSIEFWVDNGETIMYVLFDYTRGVVEI